MTNEEMKQAVCRAIDEEAEKIRELARYGALWGAIFYAAFGGENRTTGLSPVGKPYNRPAGVGNAFPLWWLAPPPFRPAGKRVTGFSVAYGSLRIQFLCHPAKAGALWMLTIQQHIILQVIIERPILSPE